MPTHVKKRALYVQEESTFGTDPTVGDSGASLQVVKTEAIGLLGDRTEVIPTMYRTGRNMDTKSIVGAEGHQFTLTVPMIGLSDAAGDAETPPADDALDLLCNACFGDSQDDNGDTMDSATASALTFTGGSTFAPGDLLLVSESDVNSGLAMWRLCIDDSDAGGDDTLVPHRAFDASPGAGDLVYGHKTWYGPNDVAAPTVTAYYVFDDDEYIIPGCRPVKPKISWASGQVATMAWDIMGNTKVNANRASAPPVISAVGLDQPELLGLNGVFEFNGVAYAIRSLEIDFAGEDQQIDSIESATGRSNHRNFRFSPTITVEPLFSSTFETAFAAGTTGYLVAKFGAGIFDTPNDRANTWCFAAWSAQVIAQGPGEDGNQLRHTVTFKVIDPGQFTPATSAAFFPHAWKLARA